MDKRGFSLVELMVTLVISSIALAGIYGVYKGQLKSYVTQNAVVDIQQNLRNALYILQRNIRMAGFDPCQQVRTTAPATLGLLSDFSAFASHNGSGAATAIDANGDGTSIAFTLDANGDTVDTNNTPPLVSGAGTIQALDTELIAFRLSGERIERYLPSVSQWTPVAENIDSLLFEYLNDSGTKLTPPFVLSDVRSVRITIGAKKTQDLNIMAEKRDQTFLTATVRVRNVGL
jgi:type IV pilus assembly protein PilW